MKKFMNVFVACAVLAHSMAPDCDAFGVTTPTTAGNIQSTQNIQSSGNSTSVANVTIEWYDGTGIIKETATVTPYGAGFDWNANFNLPSSMGARSWAIGTGKCQMTIGGTKTYPPII